MTREKHAIDGGTEFVNGTDGDGDSDDAGAGADDGGDDE